MDFKSFIYLSDRQRWFISAGLAASLAGTAAIIFLSLLEPKDPELRAFGFELFKLIVTASAVWILVLLHTSSNSAKRINQEINKFLTADLQRAFDTYVTPVKGFPLDPLNVNLAFNAVVRTPNSAIYKMSKIDHGETSEIHFFCRITLCEIITLFYLPSRHKDDWQSTYQTAFSFWDENSIKYSNAGVHRALWHPEKLEMLEIRTLRSISRNFLFEAAERLDVSEKIIGDARAMLMRTRAADSGGMAAQQNESAY